MIMVREDKKDYHKYLQNINLMKDIQALLVEGQEKR